MFGQVLNLNESLDARSNDRDQWRIVHKIVVNSMKKRRACAIFVPHSLMLDQEHNTLHCLEFVGMIDDDERNILKTIVTGYESWCLVI
jgi:hypothetical protein